MNRGGGPVPEASAYWKSSTLGKDNPTEILAMTLAGCSVHAAFDCGGVHREPDIVDHHESPPLEQGTL